MSGLGAVPTHVSVDVPVRGNGIRVTPLDEAGDPLGPSVELTGVSVVVTQLQVDGGFLNHWSEVEGVQPGQLCPTGRSRSAECLRLYGDHESEYGPDPDGVLHWRCIRCWVDRCLPGDCPGEVDT